MVLEASPARVATPRADRAGNLPHRRRVSIGVRGMRALGTLAIATLVCACQASSASSGPSVPSSASTAEQSPVETGAPTPKSSSVPQSASDLLDCDRPPSTIGGFADDFGPDGSGVTADEAMTAWLEGGLFPIPRSGYDRLGAIGDRVVYAFKSEDSVKVVVVISPRFSDLVGGAPFTVEELRTCDPSEYGADVDLGPDRRVWANAETGRILSDLVGPAHCGWQSARLLHITNDEGQLDRQYVRDPEGVLAGTPGLLAEYDEGVELPADATYSGYRTEAGDELWFTSDDRAAYVVTADDVERWPRADEPIGCS